MNEPLFFGGRLSDALRSQEAKLLSEINSLDADRILRTSEQVLCSYFVEKYKVNTVQIDESRIEIDTDDAQIDVSRRTEYVAYGEPGPVYATGTRMTYYIPFTGDAGLLKLRTATSTTTLPRADVRDSELVMVFEEPPATISRIEKQFDSDVALLKDYLAWSAEDIAPFNASLCKKVSESIKARRDKLLKDRELAEQTGFALRRRDDTPTTYIAPQVRRTVTPQLPPLSALPHRPEPSLGTEDYEHILSVISNMVSVMERSPRAFKDMDEEDLRQHFLVQLNGQYEGHATGETFNGEGKTDILIRVKNKNIFVAECKFWNGPKAFTEAIDQLQGYTTWRDVKTALIVFNRDTAMSTVLEKMPQAAKSHPNYKSEEAYESETGIRYIFRHRDDPDRDVTLTVLVFNVPK